MIKVQQNREESEMVDRDKLEATLLKLLKDASKARAKGDHRKAHGIDEAASQIQELLK